MDDTQALHLAREAVRQGNRTAAQATLAQVLKQNPRSETGWLLAYAAVDDPAREQGCRQRVLATNPGKVARQHLHRLMQQARPPPLPQALTPEEPPSPTHCPHCANGLPSRSVTFCMVAYHRRVPGRSTGMLRWPVNPGIRPTGRDDAGPDADANIGPRPEDNGVR